MCFFCQNQKSCTVTEPQTSETQWDGKQDSIADVFCPEQICFLTDFVNKSQLQLVQLVTQVGKAES